MVTARAWTLVGIALTLLASTAACDTTTKQKLDEAGARVRDEALMEWAEEILPDEDLVAAVPAPFRFVKVVRNSSERNGRPWVTVGVYVKGPLEFSRAIFYIHPDEAAARDLYHRLAGRNEVFRAPGLENDPEAQRWVLEDLEVPNDCRGSGHYISCIAHKGRVRLVTQSTGVAPPDWDVTKKELRAARIFFRAFGEFLAEDVPE